MGKPAAGTTYAQVELTDGTLLLASKWSLKKREVELTLLAGPVVKLPLDVVANVLRQAHVETHRRDWKTRVVQHAATARRWCVKREDVISSIDCTLGEGDETGETITFAVTLDGETTTRKRKLATLHGLIFKHTLAAKAASGDVQVLDTLEDVVMVSASASTATGLSVTTPPARRSTSPTSRSPGWTTARAVSNTCRTWSRPRSCRNPTSTRTRTSPTSGTSTRTRT